ncbi:MAG: ATP synthase F1 subunit epsilon, partial [Minisyncoccia bacterium]
MATFQLTIATPLHTVYTDEVDQITITTTSGEITVLPRHIPLVSPLKTGHVMVKKDGKETYFAIDGGILEVRHDQSVVVLSDRSEHADSIDIERAETAAQKAQDYMENPTDTEMDHSQLQAVMAKEQ